MLVDKSGKILVRGEPTFCLLHFRQLLSSLPIKMFREFNLAFWSYIKSLPERYSTEVNQQIKLMYNNYDGAFGF